MNEVLIVLFASFCYIKLKDKSINRGVAPPPLDKQINFYLAARTQPVEPQHEPHAMRILLCSCGPALPEQRGEEAYQLCSRKAPLPTLLVLRQVLGHVGLMVGLMDEALRVVCQALRRQGAASADSAKAARFSL